VLGEFASQEAVDNLTEAMGLDEPLHVQYWNYIVNFFQGDWGFAYSAGQPVTELMGSRIPATLELGMFAFIFSFVGALALAILATYRRRPVVDGIVRSIASFGLGTPRFFLGLVALIIFSKHIPIFPGPDGRLSLEVEAPPTVTHLYTVDALIAGQWATFKDAFMHLVLPALTLGLPALAFLTRLLRANLLDVAREPFILVARGKGLRRSTAFVRHALPNAFLPTLAASGIVLGHVIAGSVLVEHVFNWPGVGALVVDGILGEDYAPVQAFVLLAAIVYVACNLLADILSGIIDPRVRVEPTA
jgi:peptide/nickel transport system permease protein